MNKLLATDLEVEVQSALAALNKVTERRVALFGQLQHAISEVEQSVSEVAKSGDLEERYSTALKASVYNLYRLAYEMSDLVPDLADAEEQAALLRQLLGLCDSVARGSDTHLHLACRYVQRYGPVQHGPAQYGMVQTSVACTA